MFAISFVWTHQIQNLQRDGEAELRDVEIRGVAHFSLADIFGTGQIEHRIAGVVVAPFLDELRWWEIKIANGWGAARWQ